MTTMETIAVENSPSYRFGRSILIAIVTVAVIKGWYISNSVVAEPSLPQRILVIADIQVLSPEPDLQQLSIPMAEVIANLVADDASSAVVDRRRLSEVLREQNLQASALVDLATACRVCRLLGAEVIVTGTLAKADDKLALSLNAIAVAGQEVRGTVRVSLQRDRLAEELVALGPQLAPLLRITIPPVKEHDLDNSPWGRLHFLRGLSLHSSKQFDLAMVSFLRAVQADPRLIEARLWIARIYLEQGEVVKARLEYERVKRHPLAAEIVATLQQLAEKLTAAEQSRRAEEQ